MAETWELCGPCKRRGCYECKTIGRDLKGEPICPFCEDGVPCPIQKRMKPVSTAQAVEKPRNAGATEAHPKLAELQDRQVEPADSGDEEVESEETMAITKDTVSGYCGCGKRLRKDSPGAYVGKCAKCFTGKSARHAYKPRKTDQAPLVEATQAAPAESVRKYSFALTESQIDRLFLGSTFEAKCFAVQSILEQERA